MTTKQTVLALGLAAMLALFASHYIPMGAVAMDGNPVKYELNIKLVPSAALKARAPEARTLDFPASKVEGHDAFTSKEECETHFTDSDVLGIAMAMYQQEGLKIDEDFTIEHSCEAAKVDA